MRVAIVLFDGFDNLDAIGPFEVFSHVGAFGADVDVGLCTLSEQKIVTSSHGLRIQPDGELDAVGPDLVVVPGGGWGERAEEGAWGEAERRVLPERLADLRESGAEVVEARVVDDGDLVTAGGHVGHRPRAPPGREGVRRGHRRTCRDGDGVRASG